MFFSRRVGFGASCLLAAQFAAGEPAAVDEKVIAPVGPNVAYVISPQGVHLAASHPKGAGLTVTVDGVEGPAFDDVPRVYVTLSRDGLAQPQQPAVFSRDGKRHAFAGRAAGDYVLIADGKEILRTPVGQSAGELRLEFAGDDGKHLFFANSGGTDLFQLFVDGQPAPAPYDQNTLPAFSRDGARYAYVATPDRNDRKKRLLIVDGKDAGYFGDSPRFTGDGRKLLSIARTDNEATLLIDGAPAAKAMAIDSVHTAPAGDHWIAVAARPSPQGAQYFCIVDGQKVDATESPEPPRVVFSPDGKHYAARCRMLTAGRSWVVVDGAKGEEYGGIADAPFGFSPDSAKFVYVAGGPGGTFAIIDGKESEPAFVSGVSVVFNHDGSRVAYSGMRASGTPIRPVVVDGKMFGSDHNLRFDTFSFSPDGSRHALVHGGVGGPGHLVIDGQPIEAFNTANYVFSPDGKHIALVGQRLADAQNGLYVDGQLLFRQRSAISRVSFTPDGKHLYWVALEPEQGAGPRPTLYADGKPITRFDRLGNSFFDVTPGAWAVEADGALTFVAPAGQSIKRFRVPAPTEGDIAAVANALQAADAKTKSDADAAAAQAKADADAAKQKAMADAEQKRKDAAAARQKALDDAAQKRKEAQEARQKALEEARKKKQGK